MAFHLYARVPRSFGPQLSRGEEADARDAGLSPAAVATIWGAVERLYQTGTQPAIAFCRRRRGRVVLDRALGHVRGAAPDDPASTPRVPATVDTPFCLFSVSKAVTAMLVHQADALGLLRLDDRVAEYLPAFGAHGKARITLRHLLTHRAGIPSVALEEGPALLQQWDRIVELLNAARPAWVPGRRLGYHAITGGYVLGEVLQRVSGKPLRTLLREWIREPLGMRWFDYGVPAADLQAVAQNAFTGLPLPPGVAGIVRRALGVPFAEAVRVSNTDAYLTAVVPSGNVVGTARELSLFFQVLLDGGAHQGRQVLDGRAVRRALTESSWGELDLTLGLPIRYGLGFMLGTRLASPFGPRTPHAYGHYGFVNVVGWADPDRQVAAALLTSGKPFLGPHLKALWDVLAAVSRGCARLEEPLRP